MRTWRMVCGIPAVLAACSGEGADPMDPNPVVTVVLGAAGNIATCTNARDEATADLLADADWVAALGDNAFESGSLADYTNCYDPSWGQFKDRTFAALGNREYQTSGAAGAFDYFGERAGPRGKGYYSQDIGNWHVIVLNENDSTHYRAGSEQDQWLVADLAANARPCVLAMFHNPRFTSSNVPGSFERSELRALWEHLYEADAEIILNGQQHHYERMAPMAPDGSVDEERGLLQFNAGTGGAAVVAPTEIYPNSRARSAAFGILELTLKPDGYDWAFVGIPGESFTDAGTGTCR